jgi:hypothetical protein
MEGTVQKITMLLALLIMAGHAFAATDTAEKNATVYSIRFTNSTSDHVYVIIDNDGNQLFGIEPGESVLRPLNAGVHSWWGVSRFRGYEGKIDVTADAEIVIGRNTERVAK